MGSVHTHRIGWSPLSNQINLYRHGKDPGLALEQRDALNEVLTAAMHYLMDDRHPSGAVRMEFNGRTYQLTADDVTDQVGLPTDAAGQLRDEPLPPPLPNGGE